MDIDDTAGSDKGMAQSALGSPLMKDRADGDEERAERGLAIPDGDAFWEGADEEREPTGFLSSLNGSDKDETGGEEEGHEGEEEREPRLQGTVEGGAEGGRYGGRYCRIACPTSELLGKPPPKRPSMGAALVDPLGVKAVYKLPIAKISCGGRGSAAAKNRHAQQDAVGRAVSAKVVEEAFCEEGVNVHDHNAALFKQYVDEYAPDGLRVHHLRADTANIK
eukprot:jgi/Tetstr1/438623/TSEL_027174.t1